MLTLLALFALLSSKKTVYADEGSQFEDTLYGYVDALDLNSMQEEYDDYSSFFGEDSLSLTLKKYLSGDIGVGYEQMLSYVFKSIKDTFKSRVYDVSSVIFIAVLSAMTGALNKNADHGVVKVCSFVFSAATIAVISKIFFSFLSAVKESVFGAAKIIQSAYPVMLTLFTAAGAGASGGVFTPAVTFLGGSFVSVTVKILLPLVGVNFAFSTVGNLSDRMKLGKFGEFFKSAFKWTIGFSVLLFCFFLSAQSVTSSTFDGVSFKALKYAFSSGVPVVSQLVHSGFDVAFASLILVKNSVGFIAMIMLVIRLLSPILEIAATCLLIRFVAACVEPLGESLTSKSLTGCADCLVQLAALLVAVAVCFLLTVFLMITALGGSV